MFIALDKLSNQGLRQVIVVVPERTIGASFNDEPLTKFGFWADWTVRPKWNLCNAPGTEGGKVNAVKAFLDSDDRVLVCTHATFRFAMDRFGADAFDDRLIAVDEFHHVSVNPDNRLGEQVGQLMARDKTHIVAMTGSYFRGDAEPVLMPDDEARFETVTYTYYEQLSGYEYLKQLDIGYFFYTGIMPTTSSGCSTRKRRRSCTSPTSIRARAPRTKSGRSITSSKSWVSGRAPILRPDSNWSRRRPAAPYGSPIWLTTTRPSVSGSQQRSGTQTRRTTGSTSTSSLRSAWRRKASTGFGAITR